MRTKRPYYSGLVVFLLLVTVLFAGCMQTQQKPEQTPVAPTPQAGMMGQGDPSAMMRNHPEAMRNAMSAPENRREMMKMMSSPEMQNAMADMMKDPSMQKNMAQMMSRPETRAAMVKMMSEPEMRQTMTDVMADPAMRDTFTAMVKDPRLAPIAREALKQ